MGHILQIQLAMSDSTRPMLEAFLVSSVLVTDRPEGMQKRGHGSGHWALVWKSWCIICTTD